jgi:hypothetical protein
MSRVTVGPGCTGAPHCSHGVGGAEVAAGVAATLSAKSTFLVESTFRASLKHRAMVRTWTFPLCRSRVHGCCKPWLEEVDDVDNMYRLEPIKVALIETGDSSPGKYDDEDLLR